VSDRVHFVFVSANCFSTRDGIDAPAYLFVQAEYGEPAALVNHHLASSHEYVPSAVEMLFA
jgi:hypothetical protein